MRTGCGAWRNRPPFSLVLVSLLLVAALSLAAHFLEPVSVHAQSTVAGDLLSQGYTAVGPVIVAGVTRVAVQIQAGRGQTQDLDLMGKTVTVLNTQGMQIAVTALRPGTRIIYFVKENDYVITVLPEEDTSNA